MIRLSSPNVEPIYIESNVTAIIQLASSTARDSDARCVTDNRD